MSWLTDPDSEWNSGSDDRPASGPAGGPSGPPPQAQPGPPPQAQPGYAQPPYPPRPYQEPGYLPPGYPPPGYPPHGYAEPEPSGPYPPRPHEGLYDRSEGYDAGRPAQEPSGYHAFADYPDEVRQPRSKLPWIAAIVVGWLVVSLIVLIGLLAFGGSHKANDTATGPSGGTSANSSSSGPSDTTATNPNLPAGWTLRASDDQTDCAGHAYGKVATFLAATRCASVHRNLATVKSGSRTVVVASYVITFADPGAANRYDKLVTADGTGNVNDLLREGASFPGSPSKLPDAAFASKQSGKQVSVAEAAYISGPSSSSDSTLTTIAQQAVDTA